MNSIVFLILFICLVLLVYMFMDTEEPSVLQERLRSLTHDEEELEVNSKEQIKNFFSVIFKPVLASTMNKKNKRTIKNLMAEAGLSTTDDDLMKFAARRFIYAGFGLAFGGLFILFFGMSMNSLMILCAAPCGLYLMPIFAFKDIARKRTDEIKYNLPDAIDLLTICVEAGLGLDAAMTRVAQEFQMNSAVLAGEFDRVSKDVMAGMSRQDAFRNLSARNNVDDLQSFAALLIQADKLGTSIAQALKVYSDTIRTKRKQRVEAQAQQASIKMTIPLVFFVLPAMFVVILAPAGLSLMNSGGL